MKNRIKTKVQTKYGLFDIVLEKELDMGGYMITAPKQHDVISWGKNISHSKQMAREAIECSIEGDIIIEAEKKGWISRRKNFPTL